MSLEHALLDRLEKRSLQIAQQKNEIYGLRQLVNEKMTINAQLSEQITAAWLEREQMQNQISELRTERDRIREISKSLVPKSALKQAVQEAAELHAEVAKLQEVTTEKDRMRIQLENARTDLKQALVERDSLGSMAADRALEIRKLMDGHAEDMKAQAELQSKYESLLATERADAMEHCIQLRAESESLRAELQGYRAGESEAMEAAKANGIQAFEKLAGFIYRHAACLRQAQAANAPLNKLYFTMRKHRDDCNISANAEPIYRAVDEASDAIKKLTA